MIKKKQMNYGVVYGMGWVWGIFFNPTDFLGLINLQPLVAQRNVRFGLGNYVRAILPNQIEKLRFHLII